MVVRGQLGVYRFCESGVKWWGGDSWMCVSSVSQVLNGGEGTLGVYRFREAGVKWW